MFPSCRKNSTTAFRSSFSFQPKVTCSPPERPDPEKSRVKTVMFEGSNTIAASLPSALHPLFPWQYITQGKGFPSGRSTGI
uniref:Uncharacterized protein n=1 Tax=Arabidopsis thaliana TaxID=3702 RepID=Q0WLH4_ARATH|nr:hypothetical protein [Arabidopsis thaliana]